MRKRSPDIETRLRRELQAAIDRGTPLMRIAMDAGVGYHRLYGWLRRGRQSIDLTVADNVWFVLTGRRLADQ